MVIAIEMESETIFAPSLYKRGGCIIYDNPSNSTSNAGQTVYCPSSSSPVGFAFVWVALIIVLALIIALIIYCVRRVRRRRRGGPNSSIRPRFGPPSSFYLGQRPNQYPLQQAQQQPLQHPLQQQANGHSTFMTTFERSAYDPVHVQASPPIPSPPMAAGYQYPPPMSFGQQPTNTNRSPPLQSPPLHSAQTTDPLITEVGSSRRQFSEV